jgi:uncharacterized protein YdiU (UPF0061 family)
MFQHTFADRLNEKAYTFNPPTPVAAPKLLAWSNDVAAMLSMVPTDDVIQTLAGNKILPGMKPIATRYGGHQFGHWAGQLGDGRAILLGDTNGQEVQLKGAGVTPYSRRGDGRAVLRSSVREYLCSEAMHFLGIPTTRALSLVGTGEDVLRDMFYDGNSALEPGAIVTRVAPSFIRFGHFQIHTAFNEIDELKNLIDYTLSFYSGHTLESFFQELCERTAKLMVEWMRVGFVHGVMNTDNMSILGLTIDYGPYGWLDVYDPNWTPNTTDNQHRRYRFSQQPGISLWNLNRLAEALSPVSKDLTKSLESYREVFLREWEKMMSNKLGLKSFQATLVIELDSLLQMQETDMTLFYRELAQCTDNGMPENCFYQELQTETRNALEKWLVQWRSFSPDPELMNRTNPIFLVRNYLVQEAIDDLTKGDDKKLKALELALRSPYELNDATRLFIGKRPEWARSKAGCSALSCSS